MKLEDVKHVSADVYRESEKVGTITRTKRGAIFAYADNFLESVPKGEGIAFHLPYERPKVETTGVNLPAYFAGLLPEGVRIRALTRRIKTSEDDLLSLLIAAGADCIGDISVTEAGKLLQDPVPGVDAKATRNVVFQQLFEESLKYGSDKGPESSLPGVQEKLSASTISFPVKHVRANRAYLLKLNPRDKPRLVENEAFFLRMAKDCGLRAAEASLVTDKAGDSGLLVERFDRVCTAEGKIVKLHQEDACQFLDRYPGDKYLVPYSEIAEGLEQWSSSPIVDIARFMRLIAFSYLIGNGDLHAKNVSLYVAHDSEQVSLTPAYDLVSTLPYGDRRMALKLDGMDDNLKAETFFKFGLRFGVNKQATRSFLEELYESSEKWIRKLEDIGLEEKQRKDLETTMEKRRSDLCP